MKIVRRARRKSGQTNAAKWKTVGDWGTWGNLVKSAIANGIMAAAYAVAATGYVGGAIAMVVIFGWVTWAANDLIAVKNDMTEDEYYNEAEGRAMDLVERSTYGRIVEHVFRDSPRKRLYSALATLDIFITQIPEPAVIAIFVAGNLQALYPNGLGYTEWIYVAMGYTAMFALVQREAHLVWLGYVGDIALSVGMILTVALCAVQIYTFGPSTETDVILWPSFGWALANHVYAIEDIAFVPRIAEEMKQPKRFAYNYTLCQIFYAMFYITFAMLGYFAFGRNTVSIITTQLGDVYPVVNQVVLWLMVVQTAATMPITIFPESDAVTQLTGKYAPNETLTRVIVGVGSVALAIGFRWFGPLMALVGSFNGVCSLTVPPLLRLILHGRKWSRPRQVFYMFMVALGAVMTGYMIYDAFANAIKVYQSGKGTEDV